MNNLLRRVLLLLVVGATVASRAPAQSPAGPPVLIWSVKPRHPQVSGLAVRPDGTVLVSLYDSPAIGDQGGRRRLLLRGVTVRDEALEPFNLASSHGIGCCSGGLLAGNATGSLVAVFGQLRPHARRFDFAEGPPSLTLDSSPAYHSESPTGLALDAKGNFVVVWQSQTQEKPDAPDTGAWGVFGRLVDFRGNPVGPEFHVNTVRRRNQDYPSISMSSRTGAFVVVWSTDPTGDNAQVAGQLFAPGGARVGGEFRIGSVVSGGWLPYPRVAMAPDGSFVVVWQEPDSEYPANPVALGQRFNATGQALGPSFLMDEGLSRFGQYPNITMDRQGNFAISWDPFQRSTMVSLFRANGVPIGKPIALTPRNAAVTFGWNGTLAAAWSEPFPRSEGERTFARRFSASPGEEFCLYHDGTLACDTGRTGGVAEVRHPFGAAGDTGLLGDIDGDGRADPCVFRQGLFLCDTGHDYGAAETKVRFGQAGDLPLLGNVGGDGRADPCVYRDGKLRCDTAHDGGAAELVVAAGQPGDQPLLGDFDHDGRADLCFFRAGRFLCDTNLDGTLETSVAFGQPGDVPLLMDFDLDGRAEPCVFRGRELLCDTGHDGGSAEAVLVLGDGRGTPLVGNLDGL